MIKVVDVNKLVLFIFVFVDSYRGRHLQTRLHYHLTVLGELALGVVFGVTGCFSISIITFFCRSNFFSRIGSVRYLYRDIVTILIFIIVALIQGVIAYAVFLANTEVGIVYLVGAIHMTDIATAKDVTVTVSHTRYRTYLTTVDMYLGLTKDVTVAMQRAMLSQVVVTTTTTEHITVYMTAEHLH